MATDEDDTDGRRTRRELTQMLKMDSDRELNQRGCGCECASTNPSYGDYRPITAPTMTTSNSDQAAFKSPKKWMTNADWPSPSAFLHGVFKGEPAITVTQTIEDSLAAKFQTTLVGKFSQGKPGIDLIRRFIAKQNFAGDVFVGSIDKKHVLLCCEIKADYIRLYSRSIWKVEGEPMRILKWTSNFHVNRESSIVPVWLSLPMLPIHLVNQGFIFSLVSSFSKPLRIDSATERLTRPSVARVQVEFDLLDLLPRRVWIQDEDGNGFWQMIELEKDLPLYCNYCWHIGHTEHLCTIKHPELYHTNTTKKGPKTYTEYRPKHLSEKHGSEAPISQFLQENTTFAKENFEKSQTDGITESSNASPMSPIAKQSTTQKVSTYKEENPYANLVQEGGTFSNAEITRISGATKNVGLAQRSASASASTQHIRQVKDMECDATHTDKNAAIPTSISTPTVTSPGDSTIQHEETTEKRGEGKEPMQESITKKTDSTIEKYKKYLLNMASSRSLSRDYSKLKRRKDPVSHEKENAIQGQTLGASVTLAIRNSFDILSVQEEQEQPTTNLMDEEKELLESINDSSGKPKKKIRYTSDVEPEISSLDANPRRSSRTRRTSKRYSKDFLVKF